MRFREMANHIRRSQSDRSYRHRNGDKQRHPSTGEVVLVYYHSLNVNVITMRRFVFGRAKKRVGETPV